MSNLPKLPLYPTTVVTLAALAYFLPWALGAPLLVALLAILVIAALR